MYLVGFVIRIYVRPAAPVKRCKYRTSNKRLDMKLLGILSAELKRPPGGNRIVGVDKALMLIIRKQ